MENLNQANEEPTSAVKVIQKGFWDYLPIVYFSAISFIGVKAGQALFKKIFSKQ